MDGLHSIGGVDCRADIVRVFEVVRERRPLAAPGFDNQRVFGSPLEGVQYSVSLPPLHRIGCALALRLC